MLQNDIHLSNWRCCCLLKCKSRRDISAVRLRMCIRDVQVQCRPPGFIALVIKNRLAAFCCTVDLLTYEVQNGIRCLSKTTPCLVLCIHKRWAINSLFLRLVDMNITGEINILKHPSSLLIPTGEIANFSCKALCISYTCVGYWIINSSNTKNQGHRHNFERKGFTFPRIQRTNNEHTLTMFVNASNITNNSRIVCEFVPSPDVEGMASSNLATLLVISGE